MRYTQIFYPLDSDTPPANANSSTELWKSINNKLNNFKEGKDIMFDQLLQELDVSKRQYIQAIRSSLNCPTIFMKRSPKELIITIPYVFEHGGLIWIQYVLDVYTCAMYIVSYIS